MNVSRPLKLLVGAITLWAPLYFVGFMMMIATRAFASPGVFPILFMVHALTALSMFGALGFYIVHVLKAPNQTSEWRLMWAVLILFGAIVTMPIYFFMHVWPASSRHDP